MTATTGGAGLSRRAFAGVLVLVTAFAVLILVAVLPYLWLASLQNAISQRTADVRFLEARVNKGSNNGRAGLAAGDDVTPIFISGNTPGLGHAGLQRLVDRLAQENGLGVERIQPMQSDEAGALTTLRMELEATGNIENLREFLLALETGTPLVFVNEARVSPGRPSEDDTDALPSDNLSISLQLEAFAWREDP